MLECNIFSRLGSTSISKYILNEDEFGLYLKDLCNKLMKYRNYLSIINKVEALDEEVLNLLDFIYTNSKSVYEGEELLRFINKYYYYLHHIPKDSDRVASRTIPSP